MADQQLKTTTNSGTQATTKSPQTAGSANNGGTRSSQVQPGTAREALTTGVGGVPLKSTALTTIDFTAASTGTAAPSSSVPVLPKPSHTNPILLGGSGFLLLLALVLFVLTSRSAKNTTDY